MAATETRADPIELTGLADRMLRASEVIADVWHGAQMSLDVPITAFGDSAAATAIAVAYKSAFDAADICVSRLTVVLEGDMDRLYRIAFAYQKADLNAAGHFPLTPI